MRSTEYRAFSGSAQPDATLRHDIGTVRLPKDLPSSCGLPDASALNKATLWPLEG